MITKKQRAKRQAILTMAYRDHKNGLNVCAFFKLRDRASSEDLVQNTFVKAWSYLLNGGKIIIMKAFLYHILKCLITDEYRKQKITSLDVMLKKGYEPSTGRTTHLFNVLDGKAALLLINRLPEKYQKIMSLRYMKDMSLKEISVITGQSKKTIAVQIHRGLEKMKLLYTPG